MRTLTIFLSVALCAALLGFGPLAAPGKPQPPPPPPADPAITYVCAGCGQDIKVMNADGTNSTVLVHAANNNVCNCIPSWSPDGCHVIFASDMDQTSGLYIIGKDGSNLTWITPLDHPSNLVGPVWSPPNSYDGSEWIAFSDYDPVPVIGEENLFLILPDGTNRLQLLESSTVWGFNNPSWSPDGMRLAVQVTWTADNVHDILVLELEFSGDPATGYTVSVISETNVTDGTFLHGTVWRPAWAKTQDSLVVSAGMSCSGCSGGLYRLDLAPGGPPVITTLLDPTEQYVRASNSYSWSEDDQWIVFSGYRYNSRGRIVEQGIYVMPSDGSATPRLLAAGNLPGGGAVDWRRARCTQ